VSHQSSGLGTLTTASSFLGSSSNISNENNINVENRLANQNSSAHSSNSSVNSGGANESKTLLVFDFFLRNKKDSFTGVFKLYLKIEENRRVKQRIP